MASISVLIPYRFETDERDLGFQWVKKFYANMLPEAEICIEDSDQPHFFQKSQAINKAARKATGDVYVIADADMVYDPNIIYESIRLLDNRTWVIPYHRVQYLNEESTKCVLELEPSWPINCNVKTWTLDATENITVGGLNIVLKESFDAVCGFDERFKGWGGEDEAFEMALNTICGNYMRINADLYHLWHSRAASSTGNPYYQENLRLHSRYLEASGDKEKMQRLITER